MHKTLLPFSETNHFPALVADYLAGKPELRPFYDFLPEMASFREAIDKRSKIPVNREILCVRLLNQNRHLISRGGVAGSMLAAQIDKLGNANTFTVTTGHQLNIFTGPVFSIFKILSTIKLAKTLNETYPENQFVPIFWMASEDHDFDEINSVKLFGKSFSWERPGNGATGRLPVSGITSLAREIAQLVPDLSEFNELFSSAYSDNQNLASATRDVMHRLFGHMGLVVIDGDDRELKMQFRNIMKTDMLDHRSFHAVNATSEKLSAWYKPQLQAREINLFYLEPGSRERIVRRVDDGFEVLHTRKVFSEKGMLDELYGNPDRFSPNVVLRPIYQEHILPNLAYIGGPGELNYWMQLRDAFQVSGVFFPVLMLRACMMLVDRKTAERAAKLGIGMADLFQSHDFLVLQVLERAAGLHPGAESLKQEIQTGYKKLSNEWTALDPSLVPGVEAEMQKALNGLKGLEEKARRALKKKNETQLNQVKSLKDKLFPDGELQERSENILAHLQSFGPNLLEVLYNEIDPFCKHFVVLNE